MLILYMFKNMLTLIALLALSCSSCSSYPSAYMHVVKPIKYKREDTYSEGVRRLWLPNLVGIFCKILYIYDYWLACLHACIASLNGYTCNKDS